MLLNVNPKWLPEDLPSQVAGSFNSYASDYTLLDYDKVLEAVHTELWLDSVVWGGVLLLLMMAKLNANAKGDPNFIWKNHEGRRFVVFPLQLSKDPDTANTERKTKELVAHMQEHGVELGIGIFHIQQRHFGFFLVDLAANNNKVVIQVKHSRAWGLNKGKKDHPGFLRGSLNKWIGQQVQGHKVALEYDESHTSVGEDHTTGAQPDDFELVCGPAVLAETHKFLHGQFPADWTAVNPNYLTMAKRRGATMTREVTHISKKDKKKLLHWLVSAQLALIEVGALTKNEIDSQEVFDTTIQALKNNWKAWDIWGGEAGDNNVQRPTEEQEEPHANNNVVEQQQGEGTNQNNRPAEQESSDDDDIVVVEQQQQGGRMMMLWS